jgi:hypothetical protein
MFTISAVKGGSFWIVVNTKQADQVIFLIVFGSHRKNGNKPNLIKILIVSNEGLFKILAIRNIVEPIDWKMK